MTLRKWYWLSMGLLIAGALVGVIGVFAGQDGVVWIGVGIVLVTAVVAVPHLRCPHCGEALERGAAPDKDSYCPQCGREIEWDEKQGGSRHGLF